MISRIQPVGPPQAYKTYQISTPVSTHTRPATCEEIDCAQYRNGWVTRLAIGSQDDLIETVRRSGRPFKEDTDGITRTFVFEPGTKCFKAAQHRIQTRPELYVVKGGDWRGNPTGRVVQHKKPEHWVEDFGEHQLKIIDLLEKG